MERRQAAVDDARLEGFADCEELVAAMLERMAEKERECARVVRASALAEAALAVRMGQHRDEPAEAS